MKAMQPASARALTITAALVVLAGLMVMSPSGAFLAFCLATILALFPAIFGPGKIRLTAVVLLLCSIGLAVRIYPDFKSDQERYRKPRPTAFHSFERGREGAGFIV
jgi:hypothetical protein